MSSAMPILALFTIFVLLLIGIAALQCFICTKAKNKFMGLIIPIIACLGGLFVALVLMYAPLETSKFIRQMLICQIPALIYLAIFVIARLIVKEPKDNTENREIQKMNIQDL
ncbi:MAG: hypothetical protein IJ489_03325 [Clostridia bacterium]|nr:hypothetical protein [Clostridia bacterium]